MNTNEKRVFMEELGELRLQIKAKDEQISILKTSLYNQTQKLKEAQEQIKILQSTDLGAENTKPKGVKPKNGN